MLIKLNHAQVEQYRSKLTAAARSGRRITPISRLKAALAARDFTPTFVPPPPRTYEQRQEDAHRASMRRAARIAGQRSA